MMENGTKINESVFKLPQLQKKQANPSKKVEHSEESRKNLLDFGSRIPPIGTYNPKFAAIDKHIKGIPDYALSKKKNRKRKLKKSISEVVLAAKRLNQEKKRAQEESNMEGDGSVVEEESEMGRGGSVLKGKGSQSTSMLGSNLGRNAVSYKTMIGRSHYNRKFEKLVLNS